MSQPGEQQDELPSLEPPAVWIKPNEVLRLRKLKLKREALQPLNANKPAKPPLVNTLKPRRHPCNPFRKDSQPQKRKADEALYSSPNKEPEVEDVLAKKMSNMPLMVSSLIAKPPTPDVFLSDNANQDAGDLQPPKVVVNQWKPGAPVDWSLKTKLRLISDRPFPWRNTVFRSLEQASGTTSAVRCLHAGSEPLRDSIIDTTPAAQFFQHCLYWQFPHLPWISTFPRIIRNKKHGTPSFFLSDTAAQDRLFSDWTKCLTSLNQLLKNRQCLYFYLCAPTFTVLFRAAGVAGMLGAHALISPTTSSLRKALLSEDIQFTMPLRKAAVAGEDSTESSSLSQSQEEDEEEPVDWLQSLGAGDELLSALSSSKRSKQPQSVREQDSLVLVEDLQSLEAFLLDRRVTAERTGPLAGVPPTLLAPTAFVGGSLQCLGRRQVAVEGGRHVLELSGPVLPSALYHLGTLVGRTQERDVHGLAAPHAPTVPFAHLPRHHAAGDSAFATANLQAAGMDPTLLPAFC